MISTRKLRALACAAGVAAALAASLATSLPAATADDRAGIASNPTLGVPAAWPEPDPEASLDERRAWCRNEITRRNVKLDLLGAEIAESRSLSAFRRNQLDTLVATTRSGLASIDASLVTATTPTRVTELCTSIETKHLVFSLRTPQVQNAIGAAEVITRARTLLADHADLSPQIDAAELIGNPYVARMRELNAEVELLANRSDATVDGLSNALLRITPAQWLADRDILDPYQERNRAARADQVVAKADIEEIRRLLQWRPTVAAGPVGGTWSSGVRYRSFDNTGAPEVYVGVGDLSNRGNRVEGDLRFTVPSTNRFTLAFDPASASTSTGIDLGADGSVDATLATTLAPACAVVDRFEIRVGAKHKNTTVNLRNVTINGMPVGDFAGTPTEVVSWSVTGMALHGAFTVTADLQLAGKFAGGDEHNLVEVRAGCAPA